MAPTAPTAYGFIHVLPPPPELVLLAFELLDAEEKSLEEDAGKPRNVVGFACDCDRTLERRRHPRCSPRVEGPARAKLMMSGAR